MDEQEIISAKEKYDSFRNELENQIQNKRISITNEKCYLIKKAWINEFVIACNNYKRSKKYQKYTKRNQVLSLPKNIQEIIK